MCFFSRILVCASLILTSFFSLISIAIAEETKAKVIAITQITSHPSLDKVRQGLIDQLAQDGFINDQTATIHFENAQGNVAVAVQIAQKFSSLRPDVVVGIATPSAQALMNTLKGTSIPLVFGSLSDPVGAKLVDNLERPSGNITGTINKPPFAEQVALMCTLYPSLKKIGVVANVSEANTVAMLDDLKAVCAKEGIAVEVATITQTTAVKGAAESLLSKIDAFLLLQDNTVATAAPVLIELATKEKIPTFSVFAEAAEFGALATLAYDEYEIGKLTGAIVTRLLRGEKPVTIPITAPTLLELVVNKKAARALGLSSQTLVGAKKKFPALQLRDY